MSSIVYIDIQRTLLIENTLTFHAHSIKTNNEIVSASADGKIGFIGADDIAELVAEALLIEKSYNTDFILTGPELLTYDQACFLPSCQSLLTSTFQVAEIFSSVLGRTIKHTRISAEDLKKRYVSIGLPEDYAGMLAFLETLSAAGSEERIFAVPAPKKRTGKVTLRQFVEQNKKAWIV